MNLSPSQLARRAEVIGLLVKHGRRDLLEAAGVEHELSDVEDDAGGDPTAFADDLQAMGATFVKLGQLLSTRPDLLPDPYLDALAALQDDVDRIDPGAVREVVERSLGARIEDRFADFSPDPIAAASLAQVHAATLLDGRRVAVKVRRPGVVEEVRGDLEMLSSLASSADTLTEAGSRAGIGDMMAEFRSSLVTELDFEAEARHLRRLAELVEPFDRLVVPRPVDELSTSEVLVMDRIDGRKITDIGPLGITDIDGAELARQLMQAFLDQALVHGFMHADPHPGNILLTDDGDLALIDLGMVGHLSEETRTVMIDLLLALAEGRSSAAVDVLVRAGTKLDGFDRRSIDRAAAKLVDQFDASSVSDLSAGQIMVELSRACAAAQLRPPSQLTMVGKAMGSLDAVAKALDPTFEPNAAVREHAAEVLRDQVAERTSPMRAARAALASARLVESLPNRVEHLLDDLAHGELTVKVDAFDPDEFLRSLEKMVTRLTVGLLVASVVIGSAIALRSPSSTELFGYPAVAVVFFVLAALGALGLAVHGVLQDRQDRRRRKP